MRQVRSLVVVLVAGVAMGLHASGVDGLKQRMRERVPKIAALKQQQVVGENRDGFLAVVQEDRVDDAARQTVQAENADRRVLYGIIARKSGGTVEQVGKLRARDIYQKALPGVMLQAADGTWQPKR